MGRPEREARGAYDSGVHGPQRETRPEYVPNRSYEPRAPYQSERVQPYTGPVQQKPQTDGWGNLIPNNSINYDQYFNTPDINVPFNQEGEDFYSRFGVPEDIEIPMPEHEPVYHPYEHVDPNAHLNKTEEAVDEDAEVGEDGAEGDAEDGEEGEEGDEEEEEEELVIEPYMTKEYYMPGYVDTTPQKEYPPHIQHFKNYIGSIGDFQKHGYEK